MGDVIRTVSFGQELGVRVVSSGEKSKMRLAQMKGRNPGVHPYKIRKQCIVSARAKRCHHARTVLVCDKCHISHALVALFVPQLGHNLPQQAIVLGIVPTLSSNSLAISPDLATD